MRGLNIEVPQEGKVPAFLAVKDADLDIYPGEVLGGGGSRARVKRPLAGRLLGFFQSRVASSLLMVRKWSGVSRQQLIDVRRNIGIVFQDPGSSLNPRCLSGSRLPSTTPCGWDLPARTNRVSELLDLVELPRSYRNRYPHEPLRWSEAARWYCQSLGT